MQLNTQPLDEHAFTKTHARVKKVKRFSWFFSGDKLMMKRGACTVQQFFEAPVESFKKLCGYEYHVMSAHWSPVFGSRTIAEQLSFRYAQPLDYMVADAIALKGSGDKATWSLILLEKTNDDTFTELSTWCKSKTYHGDGRYEFKQTTTSDKMKARLASATEQQKKTASEALALHKRAVEQVRKAKAQEVQRLADSEEDE